MIKVLLFGQIAEKAGVRTLAVPPAATPQALAAAAPALAGIHTAARVAVNGEWAAWDTPVADGDEVAFLPPWNAL